MRPLLGAAVTACLALAACGSTPVSPAAARPVSPNRMLSDRFAAPAPGLSEIVLTRDAGFEGSMCTTRLSVDGVALADIGISEKMVIYLPPGPHRFGADANGLCDGATAAEATLSVASGGSYLVRTGYSSIGSLFVTAAARRQPLPGATASPDGTRRGG